MAKLNQNTIVRIVMLFLIIIVQTIPFANEAVSLEIGVQVPQFKSKSHLDTQQSKSPFVPGDGISIDTFPDTTSFLNRDFPIDSRGQVEFPMIGKIDITEMSVQELQNFLKDQYKNYLRYPAVRVKPVIRLSIVGGVASPGLYYIDYEYSIWDALYIAGGPLNEDGLKEMHLERNSEVIISDLISHFENGRSLKSVGVKSGDQIWVPSPTRPGFWEDAAQVLPFLTFATSLVLVYFTYQTMILTTQIRQ